MKGYEDAPDLTLGYGESSLNLEEKKVALRHLRALIMSTHSNAVTYTDDNNPFFRPEVLMDLKKLGIENFDQKINKGDEIVATDRLSAVLSNYIKFFGIDIN